MVATYGWGDIDRVTASNYAESEKVTHIQNLGGNGEPLDLFIFDRQGEATPEQILKKFDQFGLRFVRVFSNISHISTNTFEGVHMVFSHTPENSEIFFQISRVKEGDHLKFFPEQL